MRDPYELKEVEYSGQKLSVIEIDYIPEYDLEDYDLMDSKEFNKYIFSIEKIVRGSFEYRQLITFLRENMDMISIEKIVRGSFEYRQLITFLRENMDMNKCSFYENVNNIDTCKIKIHIHHHPFTLYDICLMVYNKRSFYGESLEEEMVAKEVMFLHYNLMVGLIPLAETVHELVHNNYLFIPLDKVMGNYQQFINMYEDFMSPEQIDNNYLFIPLDKVMGNYQQFINMYEDFMSPEQIDVLERNIEYTKTYIEGKQNHILSKNYVYIDLTGAYEMPALSEVITMMDTKIKQIQGKSIEIIREDSLKPLFKKI